MILGPIEYDVGVDRAIDPSSTVSHYESSCNRVLQQVLDRARSWAISRGLGHRRGSHIVQAGALMIEST